MPFFQRAVGLDPNFASAYAFLGICYFNLGQSERAAQITRKAYELRERVSQRERFLIESTYYCFVTGDMEKARQSFELWAETYPRDSVPRGLGSSVYRVLGQYDNVLPGKREAVRLSPTAGITYADLALTYLSLDRLEEARVTVAEAQAKNLDSPLLHVCSYQLAFLQNDAAGMARQVAWSAGKPGVEDLLLASEAATAAYLGRLGKARELSQQAVASAERAQEKETAAGYEAEAALREALFGNAAKARERARAALGHSTGRDVKYGVALALAFSGDTSVERGHIEKLAAEWPSASPKVRWCSSTTCQRFAHGSLSAAMILQTLSRRFRRPLLTSWGPASRSIPSTCTVMPVWRHIRVAKPRANSRNFSTIAALCSTNPSARWPISASPAPTPSPVTLPRLAPSIKTSSLYGRTPTRTLPSSERPRQNTLNCSEQRNRDLGRAGIKSGQIIYFRLCSSG